MILSSPEGEDAVKRDKKLNGFLIKHTEDQAASLVASANGCGAEAWRLLVRRYDPKTAESRRGLMKQICNMKTAKSHSDLENKILELEKLVKRWEISSGKELEDDHKVANLTGLCPEELQNWQHR